MLRELDFRGLPLEVDIFIWVFGFAVPTYVL